MDFISGREPSKQLWRDRSCKVASASSDVFSPHMIVDDGHQSSEDGSGLHSPIFGAQFPHPHGDSSSEPSSAAPVSPH